MLLFNFTLGTYLLYSLVSENTITEYKQLLIFRLIGASTFVQDQGSFVWLQNVGGIYSNW
jgi:hypothetical protein